MYLLYDTNVVLRLSSGSKLGNEGRAALEERRLRGEPAFVSAFSAWEIGMLVSKGRYKLSEPPLPFFEAFTSAFGLTVLAATPAILAQSSFLPGKINKDPADRIITATARAHALTLCTTDADLVAYGRSGHIDVLPC